jgi:hypothetical protein
MYRRSITIPISPMAPEAIPAITAVFDAPDPRARSLNRSGLIFLPGTIDKEKTFDSEKKRVDVKEFEYVSDPDEVNGFDPLTKSEGTNGTETTNKGESSN